jgi:hypothetical protein
MHIKIGLVKIEYAKRFKRDFSHAPDYENFLIYIPEDSEKTGKKITHIYAAKHNTTWIAFGRTSQECLRIAQIRFGDEIVLAGIPQKDCVMGELPHHFSSQGWKEIKIFLADEYYSAIPEKSQKIFSRDIVRKGSVSHGVVQFAPDGGEVVTMVRTSPHARTNDTNWMLASRNEQEKAKRDLRQEKKNDKARARNPKVEHSAF